MRPHSPCLSLALLLAACGGDSADPVDSTIPAEVGAAVLPSLSTPRPTVASTSTAPPERLMGEELLGRWAHYDVVAYEDGLIKTLIISYGFNDFTEVDGVLRVRRGATPTPVGIRLDDPAKRVQPDWDCERLAAERDDLFPPTPDVDW